MNITIDRSVPEPVYEQISRQIEALVRQGLLAPGARIPSIRQLAQRLGLTKNTVAVAYDELAARRIIESKRGSGTYVADDAPAALSVDLGSAKQRSDGATPMDWEPYFFQSDYFIMPPAAKQADLTRFTLAVPDPELFPLEKVKQVAASMLWSPKSFFFDAVNPQGYQPLVEHLEREMALLGIPMAPGQNEIIITGGFQRALSLLIDFLLREGDKVAIESPSYSNLLNLLIARRVPYVAIPVDREGMRTDLLAKALAKGDVRAIITIPTFHNPTGVSMSHARRQSLLALAEEFRVPVIEDDWGRLLRYEGEDERPLKSLDTGGYVIHVGTYSKCFLPGLRLGWITCPSAMAAQLVYAKAGVDKSDSAFLQALLYEFIEKTHFHRHLRYTVKEYRKRRDALCDALERYLPSGCSFDRPQGGFSVWVTLPKNIKSLPLLKQARKRGVEFTPSAFMMPDRKDTNALRLGFPRLDPAEIERGVKALCGVIDEAISNPELLSKGYRDFEDLHK